MEYDEFKAEQILKQFTPEQQQFGKAVATMRIENKTLHNRVSALQRDYDEMWKVMLVVLDACDDKELVIHESNLMRFKEEYRIDRRKIGKEIHLKLKTVTED